MGEVREGHGSESVQGGEVGRGGRDSRGGGVGQDSQGGAVGQGSQIEQGSQIGRSGGGVGVGVTHNRIAGGEQHTVVQAGSISGGLHVHVHEHADREASDSIAEQPNPVIASVRRTGSSGHVVVDAEPPHAMPPLDQVYVVTLEARHNRAVVLESCRLVVLSRRPARRACPGLDVRRVLEPRQFTADLDARSPHVTPEGADFPFSITATDVEQLRLHPIASLDEVCWHLELDWTCAGISGVTVIDDDGEPFETYPAALVTPDAQGADLRWGCGFSHAPDCPAVRLAAQSTHGTVLWFTAAQGVGAIAPDNGGADLRFSGLGARAGQRVRYEVRRTPQGLEATGVQPEIPTASTSGMPPSSKADER